MEAIVVVIGIILLVIMGFIGYLFLGLALKVCILWIPIILGFFLPSIAGFAFGAIGGGLGILLGIGFGYYVYDRWEDHLAYQKLIKKITTRKVL